MHCPNYKNGSIVNLMAALEKALGGRPKYQPLKDFNPEILAGKNIVLLVIDALGYEFLKKQGRGGFLEKNLKQKITSIFPSTTTTGVTAFLTGVPAQQHGLSGWFMYLKELETVIRTLPFTARAGKIPLTGIKFTDVCPEKSFFKKIKATGYAIQHKDYADSRYSVALTAGAKRLPVNSLNGLFKAVKQALKQPGKRKYIYAYWDGLDAVSHEFGVSAPETLRYFKKLDEKIRLFAERLENTVLLVTADHGMIDTAPDRIIRLKDHPELAETLAAPLCGELRVAYCYVKNGKAARFKKYVKQNLKRACRLYQSQDLINRKFFGLFNPNLKLAGRAGDYTLIMRDNYIIKDFVAGEKHKIPAGNHGGLSRKEMFVPLVAVSA